MMDMEKVCVDDHIFIILFLHAVVIPQKRIPFLIFTVIQQLNQVNTLSICNYVQSLDCTMILVQMFIPMMRLGLCSLFQQ